jgi:CheY-like chemotaxis protein
MPKVLVVDDYVICRRAVATILAGEGFQVLEAANGLEALALAVRHRPQLIVSDIVMPLMDGRELVERVRSDPRLTTTPVVFHTAHYEGSEATVLAAKWNVQSVLPKPSPLADMRRAIASALEATPR